MPELQGVVHGWVGYCSSTMLAAMVTTKDKAAQQKDTYSVIAMFGVVRIAICYLSVS